MTVPPWRDRWIWLALVLGAALRFHRLQGDLPYVFHWDEPTLIDNAVWMWQHGTLDPHFLHYPTGFIYLIAGIFGLVLGGGLLFDRFGTWDQAIAWLSAGTYERPLEGGVLYHYPTMGVPLLYELARGVSALAGIATILMTAVLARRVLDQALFVRTAAFLVALSPLAIEHSHVATTDMTATALAMAALVASTRAGSWPLGNWILAGALAGLAAGVKYNFGLVASALLLRVAFEKGSRASFVGLTSGAASALVGFFATTPYALLDFDQFQRDLGHEFRRVGTVSVSFAGSTEFEASSFQKLAHYCSSYLGWPGAVAAALGLVFAIRARTLAAWAVALWVLIGIVPMLGWKSFYPRYLLGPWPPLLILATWGAFGAAVWLARSASGPRRSLVFLAFISVVGIPGIIRTIQLETRRSKPDPRIEMTRWIEANLPRGERLVAEKDGPFPSYELISVEEVYFLGNSSMAEYLERGVRYLASSGRIHRIEGRAGFSRFLENQAQIEREAEARWRNGKYAIYYLPGGAEWDEEVRALLATGDTLAARDRLEAAVATSAASPAAWARLGDLRLAVGDYSGARHAFRQVLELDPEDTGAHLALADLAMREARWEIAAAHLARAESIRPDDPVVQRNWALLYLHLGGDAFQVHDREGVREAWQRARNKADLAARLERGGKLALSIRDQVAQMGVRWGVAE